VVQTPSFLFYLILQFTYLTPFTYKLEKEIDEKFSKILKILEYISIAMHFDEIWM